MSRQDAHATVDILEWHDYFGFSAQLVFS